MGLIFHRRKRLGKDSTLNVSRSGLSVSKRLGPFSINSRGRMRLRLAKGLSFRL